MSPADKPARRLARVLLAGPLTVAAATARVRQALGRCPRWLAPILRDLAGTIQLARSRLLDLLSKGVVLRRLRISIRYAPSSLLALGKNLRRNHCPPN
jgi:hypothetical protein